jgi:hypothetical protein
VRASLAALAASVAGCVPATDALLSSIDRARILAVRTDPAEARPGDRVSLSLLGASPEGPWSPAAEWAFCTAPKPLTENNVVADECLAGGAAIFAASATGAAAALPPDGCQLFGPDTPPGPMQLRPRDPDSSGGYYQPLRVLAPGTDPTVALLRISCGLAGASFDLASEFQARYRANDNPVLADLIAEVSGSTRALDALPRGAEVHLTASWDPSSAEPFVVFDPKTGTLVDRRERLLLSWFATAGSFARAHSDPGDSASASNVWRAPDSAGPVSLWLVLRDDRGGVDFAFRLLRVL